MVKSTHPMIIVGNVIVFIFIVYLIYGTIANENYAHLRWWMIINNVFVVIHAGAFSFCLFGMILITQVDLKDADGRRLGVNMTIIMLLTVGAVAGVLFSIQGFSSWVVYSYVCELREQEEDRKNTTEKDSEEPEMHSLIPV